MGDNEGLPSYFSSRAPLVEQVDLIPLNNSDKNFYWMLSVQSEPHSSPLKSKKGATLAPYEDNEGDLLDCCDLEDSYEINPTKSGKYLTSFYVPPVLLSVIIGPKGSKLKTLQDTTGTLIKVPKPDEPPIVKITGASERSVASARTQISLILLARREKLSISHFISIPMVSQEIAENLKSFKDEILKGPPTRGIDESIFQKPEKLHLTITTLTLLDEKEIEEAKGLFKKCHEWAGSLFGSEQPTLTLQGIEIMNDDPSEVDVLYGKVSLGDRFNAKLQHLADDLLELFYKNGFVSRNQTNSVKLHVTLMNSLFRKTDQYQKRNFKERESFDATYILNKFKDFYFGKLAFNRIELSVRFTSRSDGYYEAAAVVTL